MNEQEQIRNEPRLLIGIHIPFFQCDWWNQKDPRLMNLAGRLSGALDRQSLLAADKKETNETGCFCIVPYDDQVVVIAPVTQTGPALTAVADELTGMGLIEGAHLAWFDHEEIVWRSERPSPPPCPWKDHLDAHSAWTQQRIDEAKKMASAINKIMGMLPKKPDAP